MGPPNIRQGLTVLGVMTTRPWAFGVLLLYAIAWVVCDPGSFGWQGIATMATWLMTLVIQRVSHRDTQALQAKLDELLHAQPGARNEITRIDAEEPEAIELHRAEARRDD
jgi:low affinity Fe/Cu permease